MYLSFSLITPFIKSPDVIPVAQNILSPMTISLISYFLFKTDEDILRAKNLGIKDLNKKYEINEIVRGESIFCATGITSGDLMKGVIIENDKYITETIITHNKSNIELVKKVVSVT